MDRLARIALPLDMADTPDDVIDFLIRVTRLKIEDLEGEIIGRSKQLEDLKAMSKCDPSNTTLQNSVVSIENIIKMRIVAKRKFKSALIRLQKSGNKIFAQLSQGDGPESNPDN
jgi:hypothetical protein